jgi:hypothetical protein
LTDWPKFTDHSQVPVLILIPANSRPDGIKERLENLPLPDEIPSIKNSRIDQGRNAALYVSRGFGLFPFDRSSSDFAVAAVKPKK